MVKKLMKMSKNITHHTTMLGKVYTVDTSMNTTEDRVYVKENKRFSFLKSRFELVEVLL